MAKLWRAPLAQAATDRWSATPYRLQAAIAAQGARVPKQGLLRSRGRFNLGSPARSITPRLGTQKFHSVGGNCAW
jgi:hypothetical protein